MTQLRENFTRALYFLAPCTTSTSPTVEQAQTSTFDPPPPIQAHFSKTRKLLPEQRFAKKKPMENLLTALLLPTLDNEDPKMNHNRASLGDSLRSNLPWKKGRLPGLSPWQEIQKHTKKRIERKKARQGLTSPPAISHFSSSQIRIERTAESGDHFAFLRVSTL